MNTIPSTFEDSLPAYTVVGGGKRNASTGLCAVLLNRGGIYRNSCFEELQNTGFDYVLSMENSGEHFDIEELSALFPFVRFILFKDEPNIGQKINVAALEADTPLFFVLWDDFHPVFNLDAGRISSRLQIKNDEGVRRANGRNSFTRLCTVPVIQNSDFEPLPCARAPVIDGKKFETMPFTPVKDGMPSLYPFEAAGVYDRERFISLGGFDPKLNLRHWQLLDFGLRAWLWGEEIRCTQQIRFRLDVNVNAENGTADDSYFRFFLKNLAPVIQEENETSGKNPGRTAAHLPLRYFLPYLFKSGCGLSGAWRTFLEIRGWVTFHKFRFVKDINTVASFWRQP
ncbi:MAG: hypothetical protein LBP37_02815 [Spirochaetaceae bacterium]|jgi:hypothetical protein|nr:hypothetical protein [Spirochaetaceae bacterium]